MLFEEAAKRYMDDKRGRLRACTLAGYESALALHTSCLAGAAGNSRR